MTELVKKIVYPTPSHQQKLFSIYSAIIKNCLVQTQHAVKLAGKFSKFFGMAEFLLKINSLLLSHQQKLFTTC
jgi:hypothetical protein